MGARGDEDHLAAIRHDGSNLRGEMFHARLIEPLPDEASTALPTLMTIRRAWVMIAFLSILKFFCIEKS